MAYSFAINTSRSRTEEIGGEEGGAWLREPLSAALASPPRGTGESKPGEQRGGNGGGVRPG